MSIFECKALTKNYGAKTVLDRIDLTIEPGRIVGLLGPNGSGKSNISDAISWVLGEQSTRALRGAKMPPAARRRPSSRTCPTETRCPAG